MATSVITARVVGDVSDLKAKLGQVQGETAQATSAFKRLGGAIGTAFGGAAVGRIGAFITEMGQMAGEAKKLEAQTVALSRGNDKLVEAVDKSSAAHMKKLVIDDDAIRMSQNQLLSFEGLRAEIDKNPAVLDRYTMAVADIQSTISGGIASQEAMSQGSIQLAKALENPKEGLNALSRSGIKFTDQQKKQILALQEAGDMTGAQNLMLQSIEHNYGGAAEAAAKNATVSEKLTLKMDNLKESIGGVIGGLGPFIELTGNLTMTVGPLIPLLAGGKGLAGAFGAIGGAVNALRVTTLSFLASPAGLILLGGAALVAGAVLLIKNWDKVKDFFAGLWPAIQGIFKAGVNGIIWILNQLIRAMAGPFGQIGRFGFAPQWLKDIAAGRLIPQLAAGGIVTSPTLALLGEGGHDEAVIPLDRGGGMLGGVTINVSGAGDPRAVATEVRRELLRLRSRNASVGLT